MGRWWVFGFDFGFWILILILILILHFDLDWRSVSDLLWILDFAMDFA